MHMHAHASSAYADAGSRWTVHISSQVRPPRAFSRKPRDPYEVVQRWLERRKRSIQHENRTERGMSYSHAKREAEHEAHELLQHHGCADGLQMLLREVGTCLCMHTPTCIRLHAYMHIYMHTCRAVPTGCRCCCARWAHACTYAYTHMRRWASSATPHASSTTTPTGTPPSRSSRACLV